MYDDKACKISYSISFFSTFHWHMKSVQCFFNNELSRICMFFQAFIMSSVSYVQGLLCLASSVMSRDCYVQGVLCLAFVMCRVCYVQSLLCLAFVRRLLWLVFVMSRACYVQRRRLCLGFVLPSVCYVLGLLCPGVVTSKVCYVQGLSCVVFVSLGSVSIFFQSLIYLYERSEHS